MKVFGDSFNYNHHYITLHYANNITLHSAQLHYTKYNYNYNYKYNYTTLRYVSLISLHYHALHYTTLHYTSLHQLQLQLHYDYTTLITFHSIPRHYNCNYN